MGRPPEVDPRQHQDRQHRQQLGVTYGQLEPEPPIVEEPSSRLKIEIKLEENLEVIPEAKVEVKAEVEIKTEAEVKYEADIKMEDIKMEDLKVEDGMKMEVKEEMHVEGSGVEYFVEFKWEFDPQMSFERPVAALLWSHVPYRY